MVARGGVRLHLKPEPSLHPPIALPGTLPCRETLDDEAREARFIDTESSIST
jgi:hypothetical protein